MKTIREIAEMHYQQKTHNEADEKYKQMRIDSLEKLLTEQLNIAFVMAMLPSDKEVEAEASSYDNSMSSIAESVWMPAGVKAGVKWIKDYMLKKVTGN